MDTEDAISVILLKLKQLEARVDSLTVENPAQSLLAGAHAAGGVNNRKNI